VAASSSISWTAVTPTGTTVSIEIALSTDNGATWTNWLPCTNGQAVPGIDELESLQNVQLKTRAVLTTTDVHASPELQEVSIEIITAWADITLAYGPNKSTLTGWDSISLAWKPERLSLVVNDEEACYIENPGLPASLGSHVFIGTDRNGANAINTLVDELRIDKVYREPNIRTAWHKMGVPFYTSEDMKQWPGYVKVETDGLKVYDPNDALRVLVGSWLKDAVRKYGIKIIDGEIYSSLIRSGAEDADTYIQFKPPNNLEVYYGGYLQMLIEAVSGGRITFYNNGTMIGRLSGAYSGADLGLIGIDKGKIQVAGDLHVVGSITKTNGLNFIEPTKDYGIRLLNALESPELKYIDMGRAYLVDGEATVYLDPILLQCIEPDTELTPWLFKTEVYGEGEDIRVIEWGKNYFKVKECNGGTSNRKFGWWFYATRINYGGIRLQEYV
jgi:hypothetical protein